MKKQEIPANLERFAIRLHNEGKGIYTFVASEGAGQGQCFFQADTDKALEAAVKEMVRRRKISDALRKKTRISWLD